MKSKKILVMGLPGSGKTYFAKALCNNLKCAWYNADKVRTMSNDWDFSINGRLRQAERMKTFADFEKKNGRLVICDFVCPTKETRNLFDPDIIVWMNTLKEGRFKDTNLLFENPENADIIIQHFNYDINVLTKEILNA